MLKCGLSGSQVKGGKAFLAFLCRKEPVVMGMFTPSFHFLSLDFMPKG